MRRDGFARATGDVDKILPDVKMDILEDLARGSRDGAVGDVVRESWRVAECLKGAREQRVRNCDDVGVFSCSRRAENLEETYVYSVRV